MSVGSAALLFSQQHRHYDEPRLSDLIWRCLVAVRRNVHSGDFCAPINSAAATGEAELAGLGAVTRHLRELRAFGRWLTPTLTAIINGRAFIAANWSPGGVLLTEVGDYGWKCGASVEIAIGLPGRELRTGTMIVVRYLPDQNRLALRSHRFSPVLMDVKLDCDAAGIAVFADSDGSRPGIPI